MLAMVATTLTLFKSYALMCVGRLLFGLCCGVIIYAGQKMLDETLPASLVSWSGAINMVFLFVGVLTQMFVCMILPTEDNVQA